MQMKLLPGAAILLVLFLLTLWAFKFLQRRSKLPPGPTPWLFLGNLLQKDVLPLHKTYAKLTKKYGPVFTFWLGAKLMLVICGYGAVKDALVTHNEEFGGRPPIVIFDHVTRGYGQSFDIIPDITAAIGNVMCSVIFGNRYSYEDDNFIQLLEIVKAFTSFFVSIPGVVYSALPNIMNFLPGPHKKVFSDCNTTFNFIRNNVDAHKKTLDSENPRDFIDCFLLKLEKEHGSSLLCMEDLVMSVFQLFLAGTEGTATAISYGLILLARFPRVQAKAQQEIDELVGAVRALCMEDRMKLSYTNALLHEIVRFQQGTTETFPHMTAQDVNFRGHFIPQGTIVLPLWVSVHFDPLCWEDPEKFDPGHFLNEKGEFQKNDAYMPFSAGKRACPGEAMADMEIFLLLSTLLQHFTFELILDPEDINLETLFMDLRKNGKHCYLRAIKRDI